MTDETSPETTDAPEVEQPTTDPDVDEPADEADEAADETKAGKEAAKYRRRLRDTEAERDTLREQLDAARRAIVETHAAQHLTKPSALWVTGASVDALLDTDGNIDPTLVEEACSLARDQLGAERPGYAPDDAQGARSAMPARTGWTDAFAPKR